MRRCLFIFLASCLVFMGTLTPCRAEMYVEGYVGGSVAPSQDMSFSNPRACCPDEQITHHIPGKFDDPFVIGGFKWGFWLDKDGLMGGEYLCSAYRDWMKYFGFYIDINYQGLDFERQTGVSVERSVARTANVFSSDGDVYSVGFMFATRYGFLQDKDVPFGRIQPYFGIGPAILVTSQKPTLVIDPKGINGGPFRAESGRETEVVPALEVEPGIRWMLARNLSVDLSLKYRFAEPSFEYRFRPDNNFVAPGTMRLEPDYHLLSAQLGIAFHF